MQRRQRKPVLTTWDISSGNGHIARERTRLLAQTRGMRVQSITAILLVLVFPSAYFHEGEVSMVVLQERRRKPDEQRVPLSVQFMLLLQRVERPVQSGLSHLLCPPLVAVLSSSCSSSRILEAFAMLSRTKRSPSQASSTV